uniref:Uncharacterized protein n=1 Tax=Anopheles minimus TaxID=112268 RepID=A0A182WJZ0_9DIPT
MIDGYSKDRVVLGMLPRSHQAVAIHHGLFVSMYILSSRKTAEQIPIMKMMLIVTISIVIWWPLEHIPVLITRCGPPIPFTMVKCVELATETESGSLPFSDRNGETRLAPPPGPTVASWSCRSLPLPLPSPSSMEISSIGTIALLPM